jgi:hypothetical protein
MMAPGSRALAFASRWFDPALVHRTFEPLIADWQREWHDSVPSRRLSVSVRAWAAFVCAALISTPSILLTPIPSSIARRVTLRITTFCLVAGGLLSIPMLRSMGGRELDPPLWASLLLMVIPAAVSIAFPFAMVIAVDAIRRNVAAPHVERAAALKLGAIGVCFLLTMGSFVGPLASRQFTRVTTPPGWNIPGPRIQQLSTVALLNHPDRSGEIVPGHYTRAGDIRRELMNRSVFSLMPAMFVWLRWSALSHQRRRRWWPLPASAMTALVIIGYFVSFFGGFRIEFAFGLQPGTGLLLPLMFFGAWALTQQRLARRGQRAQCAPQATH